MAEPLAPETTSGNLAQVRQQEFKQSVVGLPVASSPLPQQLRDFDRVGCHNSHAFKSPDYKLNFNRIAGLIETELKGLRHFSVSAKAPEIAGRAIDIARRSRGPGLNPYGSCSTSLIPTGGLPERRRADIES
jgi:hypothetical protein